MRTIGTVLTILCLGAAGCGPDEPEPTERDRGDVRPATTRTVTRTVIRTVTQAPPTAALSAEGLEACLTESGADLARSPGQGDTSSDLGFALPIGDGAEVDLSAQIGDLATYSVKPSTLDPADGRNYNGDWRVYWAVPDEPDAPGYSEIVEDPGLAEVAAYVAPDTPGTDSDQIAAADRCLDPD